MAAHAVSVDELHHAGLTKRVLMHLLFAGNDWVAVNIPTQRRVRNLQIGKDVFVEPVLPKQQLVQARQERARLGALDDSVIVSAADGDCLTDAKLRQDRRMD